MKIMTANIINAMLIVAVLSAAGQCASAREGCKRHQNSVRTARMGHPTAAGSFLGTKVYTASDLIYQLETHPTIAARYARHYHTTPDNIIRYMRENLVESYMPRTQTFKTYWVRGNGQIKTGHERLTKGTRVFALRNGQPVLKWACGNPLTAGLPPVRTVASSTTEDFHTKVSPSEETLVPSEPADVIIPTEAPPVMVTQVPSEELRFSTAAIPPVAAGGGFSFPWLPVAAIPVIVGVTHPGGGGDSPPPPPVPESSSIISFAAATGFGVLMLARRRRLQRA